MPTKRKQNLIVFSDQAMEKLTDDANRTDPPSSVQDIVREIVNQHYGLEDDPKKPIVRGRPRKT